MYYSWAAVVFRCYGFCVSVKPGLYFYLFFYKSYKETTASYDNCSKTFLYLLETAASRSGNTQGESRNQILEELKFLKSKLHGIFIYNFLLWWCKIIGKRVFQHTFNTMTFEVFSICVLLDCSCASFSFSKFYRTWNFFVCQKYASSLIFSLKHIPVRLHKSKNTI